MSSKSRGKPVERSAKKSDACYKKAKRANSVCLECTAYRSLDQLFDLSRDSGGSPRYSLESMSADDN